MALLDNFNRADEGPPPSASWTNGWINQNVGNGIEVFSNQARRNDTGDAAQDSYWTAPDFGPAVEVECVVSVIPTATGDDVRLGARLVDVGVGTTDGYALLVARDATGQRDWFLYRVDNEVFTQIATVADGASVVAGDSIKLVCNGSSIEGWHKPAAGSYSLILSAADATYAAAGKVGLAIKGTAARVDDFGAATLAAGGPSDPPGMLALVGVGGGNG